ncbi:HAD family phosphatase [Halocella sp. SP3-1]|uniref:HAD family hydrolase n=1 Tax=Halocella sp. SP3-1 TaxID=2382161 RepID=UPI000F7501C3|nr:HAD family phosphatase [Halocella sp. SP3-1]AZO93641.1 HAD family phosphatase [Halocella sp. SP3-1]
MIKAVIFDMDGLMFDTENMSKKLWKKLGKKHRYNFEDSFFDRVIGLDLSATIKVFEDVFGSDFPYEELKKDKNKMMIKEIKDSGIPIKKGLKEAIKFLKENDILIAVASSSKRSAVNFYLESAELKDKFDFIIGGDEVKCSKPSPEIFLKCYEILNVKKEQILILEDSINGIKAANKAEIKVVLIPDLVKVPCEIEKLTFAKLTDLTEVPKLIKKF